MESGNWRSHPIVLTVRNGVRISSQRRGLPESGPISHALHTMGGTDQAGRPISPAGADLLRLVSGRKIWVIFVHTAGGGAAPWYHHVVLDADYRQDGQVRTPGRVGLIAHELTHVLQRELNDPVYFPNGGLRFNRWTRWIWDSTNYMEVLAYLIGWSVEYDLLLHQYNQGILNEGIEQLPILSKQLRQMENMIAAMLNDDVEQAIQFILQRYSNNSIYRQNYEAEKKYPDKRIPPGGWAYWLKVFGFSEATVEHIRQVADVGHKPL